MSGRFIGDRFYFADPFIGLVSAKIQNETWSDERIHLHLEFANQANIGPDGVVYVSNSFGSLNRRFTHMENFYHHLFAGSSTGSVHRFDPKTGETKVLINNGLRIANGIAASEKYLFVGDMMHARIGRYNLVTGEYDPDWKVVDMFPDNLEIVDSSLYVALNIPRNGVTETVFYNKIVRNIVARLPPTPVGNDPGGLLRLDLESGKEISAPRLFKNMPGITGIIPRKDDNSIFISSYFLDGAIAKVDLK